MENYIITISRLFASRGHEIAGMMGSMLDIPVYDRSAVEARVQSLQMEERTQDHVQKAEEGAQERPRTESGGKSLLMSLFRREMRDEIRDEAQLEFERQSEVLRSLVREGPCIILGRCADQVFEEEDRALHIYLFASMEERIRNTMEMLHTGQDEARTLIQNEDRAREEYRRRFSSHPENEVAGRHILMDTGKLGAACTAQLLVQAARHLFCE